MKHLSKSLAASLCALALQPLGICQDYRSNDLTPSISSAAKFAAAANGVQIGAALTPPYNYAHAMILRGNALTPTDLTPAGSLTSFANASDDTQQAGWANSPVSNQSHATVWNGTPESYVDLHPSGYSFSECLGVHNGEQVGYAQNQTYFVTASHAFSWHGTAASVVDLHPTTWTYPFSRARSCHNGEEVGYVSTVGYPEFDSPGYHTTSHAVRWSGTAASAVDLHPIGYDASEALCTSGTQQGGYAYIAIGTTHTHAMIWSGTPESAIDLHPPGYTDTKVLAIVGNKQVGEGWVGAAYGAGSVRHALVWTGTPESVIDLNQYLPPGYTDASATGIDAIGNVVGFAYKGADYTTFGIKSSSIAVVFAPGNPPPTQLASITLSSSNVAPGDPVNATVALGGLAPAGGVTIQFQSTSTNLVPTPSSAFIPEGASNAVVAIPTGGLTMTTPAGLKLYASDGIVSRVAPLVLTPVVKLASMNINAVEGGFSTYGTVTLNIPAQASGAAISLTSGNSSLVSVPPTLTLAAGYTAMSFSLNTAPVSQLTSVPITASFNGTTVTANVSLNPAPVVSLSGLTGLEMVGGQPSVITVTLNNFPRAAAGAVISLTSSDVNSLQVPATMTVPYGAFSASVAATTSVVPGRKGVTVKASYNGSQFSTTVFVDPIPTVTITQADYLTDTHMFKVQASTTFTNAVLTYGGVAEAGPLGTMQFEAGVFKGSMILGVAPTRATVWNSLGGMATVPVVLKTSSAAAGGGGGGGGGGGSSATAYKLSIVTNGKGSVTASPSAASYAAGTVVTLTATPAAGSPWIGWTGAVTGTSNPIKVTITGNLSVTANFR